MTPPRSPNPPGALRARTDLVFVESGAGDETTVVKDPVTLEYFRLGEREAFLLRELREPLSVDELHRRYARRFPAESTTAAEVLGFCAALQQSSLLAGPRGAGADPPSAAASAWLNPLAIRLPSFDPTPLLHATGWLGRVLFSAPFAALLMGVGLLVAVLLLGRAEEALAALGDLARLSDPRYAALGLVALAIVKSWHELGHALACRRFGAECHEMGVLLLVFMPCLYCDVTDAWTLAGRWRRAVVALAGVYFEAVLAVAAAAAWLVLEPGVARTLSLYVVVIASVSTLLVNLNPLIRFDGYYLLADCWGVANLHQQSRRALWGPLTDWIAGRNAGDEQFDAPRPLLAAYGLASAAYKVVLLAVILWGVHSWLAANDLRPVGDALVAVSLVGVAVAMARGAAGLLATPAHRSRLAAFGRLALVAGAVGGAGWFASTLSIEQSLKSPCRLESARWVSVAAPKAGELLAGAAYGDRVERGAAVATLRDPAQELDRLSLLEELAGVDARLAGLRRRAPSDPALLAEIARAETLRGELRRQLRTHDELAARNTIAAPIAGRLLRPPERAEGHADRGVRLVSWTGAPLDGLNRGCAVEAGDELCLIAGEELRAVVLLDQHDSGLVRVGDQVKVLLDRDPRYWLPGEVEGVALAASDDAGARPTGTSDVVVEGALRGPLEQRPTYRVSVTLRRVSPSAQHGAVGQARIVTGRETVLEWCLRWARRTLQPF